VGPAVEVVDVDPGLEDLEAILAGDVFHRGVVFGEADSARAGGDVSGVTARVRRDGSEEASAEAAEVYGDLPAIVQGVARRVGEAGEHLRAGERVIAGSLTPIVWVSPGDALEVDFGPLGALRLSFTP
jgi:2-oxo-hept-3-ene-1,7-dioate hydratase